MRWPWTKTLGILAAANFAVLYIVSVAKGTDPWAARGGVGPAIVSTIFLAPFFVGKDLFTAWRERRRRPGNPPDS